MICIFITIFFITIHPPPQLSSKLLQFSTTLIIILGIYQVIIIYIDIYYYFFFCVRILHYFCHRVVVTANCTRNVQIDSTGAYEIYTWSYEISGILYRSRVTSSRTIIMLTKFPSVETQIRSNGACVDSFRIRFACTTRVYSYSRENVAPKHGNGRFFSNDFVFFPADCWIWPVRSTFA